MLKISSIGTPSQSNGHIEPAKTMPHVQRPSTFLFVNKDASSRALSRDDGPTAAQINRHAQLSRMRASPVLMRRKSSRGSDVTKRIVETGWRQRSLGKSSETDLKKRAESEERDPPSSDAGADAQTPIRVDSGVCSVHSTPSPTLSDLVQTSILKPFISNNTSDPFASSVINLDCDIREIVRHYLLYSLVSTFRTETLASRSSCSRHRYYTNHQELVRSAMMNEGHIFSLLAATAGRMAHIPGQQTRFKNIGGEFMGRAIHNLRLHLQDHQRTGSASLKPQMITDILHLCIGEWYRGNCVAALLHLRSMRSFLQSQVSVSNSLDRYVLEKIFFHDVFITIETGGSPVFSLTWHPEPLSPSRKTSLNDQLHDLLTRPRKDPLWNDETAMTQEDRLLGTVGPFFPPTGPDAKYLGVEIAGAEQIPSTGFDNCIAAEMFSEEMLDILRDLRQWSDMAAYVFLQRDVPDADVNWAGTMAVAITHRLLSLPQPVLEGEIAPSLQYREECVRLSLVLMMSQIVTPMVNRSGGLNATRLRSAFTKFEEASSETNSGTRTTRLNDELMLWVLFTGLFTAGISPTADWFMDHATELAERLNVRSYIQLHKLAGRFLHFATQQYASLMMLAKRLQDPSP